MLNFILDGAGVKLTGRLKKFSGWLAHYLIGFAFVLVYETIWHYTDVEFGFLSGIIFGVISGFVGIACWRMIDGLPNGNPHISSKEYAIQLFFGHVIFAVAVVVAVVVPVAVPWRGRILTEWLPIAIRYGRARWAGRTDYRSSAPHRGTAGRPRGPTPCAIRALSSSIRTGTQKPRSPPGLRLFSRRRRHARAARARSTPRSPGAPGAQAPFPAAAPAGARAAARPSPRAAAGRTAARSR